MDCYFVLIVEKKGKKNEGDARDEEKNMYIRTKLNITTMERFNLRKMYLLKVTLKITLDNFPSELLHLINYSYVPFAFLLLF